MTVNELMHEWIENEKSGHIKPRTYQRYIGLISDHISPKIGEYEISQLTRKRVLEFINDRKTQGNQRNGGGLSPSSVNMLLTLIKLAFRYARDMEYTDKDPCVNIKYAKDNASTVDAFSAAEQLKIEKNVYLSNDKRLDGIILCLYTGLRIGELLALTWDDFDPCAGTLKINKTIYRYKDTDGISKVHVGSPKTESSNRAIPLPPHISDMLSRNRLLSNGNYVIANKNGEQMSIRSYQYIFRRLTVISGVRQLSFHALRHTFTTRAIECGIDVKTVSEILGHKNASITLNRYAHCIMDHKILMVQRLQRIYQH